MTQYYYPQRMGRIILQAMDEILGHEGTQSILRFSSLASSLDHLPESRSDKTFSFETLSRLIESLEQAYGPQGGRGTALRVGRACFQYGLREYGSMLGLTEMAFRLLPLSSKLSVGSKSFADLFNKHTDQIVRIEENEQKIFWHIERCPLCWERHTTEPACHLAVGLLQESLYWVSGGKTFNVEEINCAARGDAVCSIAIDKMPIA